MDRTRQRKWIGQILPSMTLCHRGKNGGEEDKGETKTDDAELDDEGRI